MLIEMVTLSFTVLTSLPVLTASTPPEDKSVALASTMPEKKLIAMLQTENDTDAFSDNTIPQSEIEAMLEAPSKVEPEPKILSNADPVSTTTPPPTPTQPTSENVDQDIVKTRGKQKIEVLEGLLQQKGFDKVILFGRTKWGIEKLSKNLHAKGFKVAAIHGNKSQSQRQQALENFKKNRIQVLLATDIAARGIDVVDVTHVINYDMPGSYEDYIHRIGRTGRASKSGVALTFVD